MSLLRKELVVFFKLWLMMLLTYVVVTLAFDLAYHGWIDLRHETLARLTYVPLGQAAAFQLLTWPKRRSSAP